MRIDGEMTIYSAAALKERILAGLDGAERPPRLDLSGVTEIDTAGLQLLLLARRVSSARGTSLSIVEPSEPVRALLRLCRLEALIERSMDAGPRPAGAGS